MIKFIDNVGDYFASNYFDEDFLKKVFEKSSYALEDIKEFNKRISPLKDKYYKYKNEYLDLKRAKDRIKLTHQFHTELLNALSYNGDVNDYAELCLLNEKEGIPVRSKLYRGDSPHLFIMEMQAMISVGNETVAGIFEQVYYREQWEYVFKINDPELSLSPSIINEALSELFLIEQARRPMYVLLLAGAEVYLIHYEKWFRGSYLRFSLEDLFDEATLKRDYYALFYFLLSKEALAPDSDIVLMDQLDEDSHKSAYAVTQDLKAGIIKAIENLANEAVYYLAQHDQLNTLDEQFANRLKDDCLTIVYRLLFLFYAESRPELEILPTNDEVYEKGYSLEMLRDLEQVPLQSESAKNGYFFHDSLWHLFTLVGSGYNEEFVSTRSFIIKHIDSPLFDDYRLSELQGVKFRNFVWQDIICQLSLSQKQRGKTRGRISYANLGINQLGSVYEGLLSYKGFFAEEDYIEVKKASDATGKEGTYVVPRSRRGDFDEAEILKDNDNPERDQIIRKGSFIYRLSGRDRQKSASYYTPEVLTQTTVKYTLKPILERLEKGEIKADELLKLKILEPAMGAAAFHNEAINQIAVAYLDWKQKEKNKKIPPNDYREELQRVKAYIATHNVYGVDINPTAVELGKLSLWLNVIHKDMETPFFGYRLGVGNAVVGAWRKVYSKDDAILKWTNHNRTHWEKKEWWNKAPRQIPWSGKGSTRKADEIYHFLLPDRNMLASANINLLKEEFPRIIKGVQKWKQEFTKPISSDEFKILQAISEQIDKLFEDHYQQQKQVNLATHSFIKVWGQQEQQQELFDYNQKERLADARSETNAPYYKLKMIMDYWCSLWFWDVRDAEELPTRQEYIEDIMNILELDIEKVLKDDEADTSDDIFAPATEQMGFGFAQPAQQRLKSYKSAAEKSKVADAIAMHARQSSLLPDRRKELIIKYSQQYRFFHYELDFVEVFKERGGFDVIVGNPPWINITLDETGILSENHPEIILKNYSSPTVKKIAIDLLKGKSKIKHIYVNEFIWAISTKAFLGSVHNFSLLQGQRNNLYKCVLYNSLILSRNKGYIGLLHPEEVYSESKAEILRSELYKRLIFHFQFRNELKLFKDIQNQSLFSINVYRGESRKVGYYALFNLFHPQTIDSSLLHDGQGHILGIKIKDLLSNKFTWNLRGHKRRIIKVDEDVLIILKNYFSSDSEDPHTTIFPSIHGEDILSVIKKIGSNKCSNKLEVLFTDCWNEVNAINNNIIKRCSKYPTDGKYEQIFNGGHLFVANPFYKNPIKNFSKNTDYDNIDLLMINEDFIPRTNYIPTDVDNFLSKTPFTNHKPEWIESYRLAFNKMLDPQTERTLKPAIIPPKSSHINGVFSMLFNDEKEMLIYAAFSSSLIIDFIIKISGNSNLTSDILLRLPFSTPNGSLVNDLVLRMLGLNCLNNNYKKLWENNFPDDSKVIQWSVADKRLNPFRNLTSSWEWKSAIRNHYARRLALIEIDVLVALSLGLTLEELISIYSTQFPIIQQYEDNTYFDREGNIIFTINKGLAGVGLEGQTWEKIKNNKEGQLVKHTITKSELYYGKEIIYYPPFEKCDRIEDYKRAWAHFEKVFAESR